MKQQLDLSQFFQLEIVGDMEVTGKVTVQAAAWDGAEPIVLYLSGSSTGVNAVRASLNSTKAKVTLRRKSYGSKILQASRPMKQYHTRDEYLEEDHLLLLSDKILHPQSADLTSYVMTYADEASPTMSEYGTLAVGQRIKKAVTIPILPEWYAPIIERGMSDRKIVKADTFGCRVWGVYMKEEYWTETIQSMLKSRQLAFPVQKQY